MTRRHWLQLVPPAALAGCGTAETRADLVFVSPSEPETLDPALASDQASGRVITSLFEGLMRWDEAGQAIPGVAVAPPEVTPDGLNYRFRLRPEARWANGDRVTAHDFLGSWKRVLDPATAADYVALLHIVRNAAAFSSGRLADFSQVGLRAPTDDIFEVALDHPAPYLPDLCALFTLCPVHLPTVARYGSAWARPQHLLGNGAYRLAEWRLNYRLRLDRSETYWDREAVRMKTVDLRTIANPVGALNYFLTREADLTMDKDGVPVTLIDRLRRAPYYHSGPMLGSCFMRFNVARESPFRDRRVRQAFSLVIDRDQIVERVTRMGEPAAYSVTPPGCGNGFAPSKPPTLVDIPRARSLLAEAGFANGRGFPLVTYLYPSRDLDISLAIEIQAMWESALGVKILPQKQEWKVYLDSMRNLDYDICRSSWVGDYNDPNTFLEVFTSENGNNRTGWKNPDYDALIEAAGREPAQARRFEIFRQAEEMLNYQEAVTAPVYHYVGVQIFRPQELGGVETNLVDEHPFRCMFWKT